MIKKIYRQSFFILIPAALISAVFDWKRLPLSILIGGIVGLANLKGLAWGVEGLVGTQKAATKLVFFSMIRLFIIFTILIALFWLRLVNALGVFIGFTIVLAALLKEGFRTAKEEL